MQVLIGRMNIQHAPSLPEKTAKSDTLYNVEPFFSVVPLMTPNKIQIGFKMYLFRFD